MHTGSVCSKKETRVTEVTRVGLCKEEFCLTMVTLPCLCNRLGPLGLVQSVGMILSLQADTATARVPDTTLTGGIQEVGRIKLHTGAIGDDAHGAAGFRVS